MDKMSHKAEEASSNLAQLRAKADGEPVASFLGMTLKELGPGYARVTMKLKSEYRNFNGLVFGGVVMAVADQAFAYGSNSLSYPSLASQFNIHFVSGAGVGDELTAECRVVRSGRRVGISEIVVTSQDGKLIAKATGTTIPVPERGS
jgi:acyl-CoA thioesterase